LVNLAKKFASGAVEHDDGLAALDPQHDQRVMRLAPVESQRVAGAALRWQIKAMHMKRDK